MIYFLQGQMGPAVNGRPGNGGKGLDLRDTIGMPPHRVGQDANDKFLGNSLVQQVSAIVLHLAQAHLEYRCVAQVLFILNGCRSNQCVDKASGFRALLVERRTRFGASGVVLHPPRHVGKNAREIGGEIVSQRAFLLALRDQLDCLRQELASRLLFETRLHHVVLPLLLCLPRFARPAKASVLSADTSSSIAGRPNAAEATATSISSRRR